MIWHHSQNIVLASPATISASTQDHSGQIILGTIVVLILAFIGGLTRD